MSTVLLAAGILLVLVLLARATAGCRRELAGHRTRDQRRAALVATFTQARTAWDADTARIEAALADVLNNPTPGPLGFGDSLVVEEQVRRAFSALETR